MQKTGKSVCPGDQLSFGGEYDGEGLEVLFECPVSDGVGQREASEIGVVEEDVVRVPRQVPHGLGGGQCSIAQESMHLRDHDGSFQVSRGVCGRDGARASSSRHGRGRRIAVPEAGYYPSGGLASSQTIA